MEEYKRICPNCYKEVSSRDMYLDLESGKIGCTYCFEDKIRQHSDWCKEWRKKNMAGENMTYPKTFEEFINQYSFKDRKQEYTNGSMLISVVRVLQAYDYYCKKQAPKSRMQYVVTTYDDENFYFDFDTHELQEYGGTVTILNQKGQIVFLVPLSKVECIIVKEVGTNKNIQDGRK